MHTALVFASSRLRRVASSSVLPRGRRVLPNATGLSKALAELKAAKVQHVVADLPAAELRALVQAGQLDAALARDLLEALHFLMGLKLLNNLAQRLRAQPVTNLVAMSSLSTLERDRLKDTLAIVKRFRQQLQQHFRLGAL